MGLLRMLGNLARAYTTGGGPYGDNQYKDSSVPLEDGGDTHFHKWKSGKGVTVTTRLRGGFTDHTNVRDDRKSSGENLTGFRSVFGDDNKD